MINSYARISWMSLWSDCHTQIKFQHWRQCFSIRWSHVNHKPANIKGCTNYEWPHQYGWCYGYDFGGPRQFGGWIFDSMEADFDQNDIIAVPGGSWTYARNDVPASGGPMAIKVMPGRHCTWFGLESRSKNSALRQMHVLYAVPKWSCRRNTYVKNEIVNSLMSKL